MSAPLPVLELLERMRKGDVIAVHDFYRQVEPFLRNLARRHLGGGLRRHVDSTDLAQSAFRRILVGSMRARFDDEARALSWMATIIRNRVRSIARSSAHRLAVPVPPDGEPEADRPGPAALAADSEELLRFREAMQRLPDRERHILALRDFQDLEYAEVGRQLEPPASAEAVRKAHDRALEKVRRSMGEPS